MTYCEEVSARFEYNTNHKSFTTTNSIVYAVMYCELTRLNFTVQLTQTIVLDVQSSGKYA